MTEEQIDYYAVLGIERDADLQQIKAAYRSKSKENHPDRGGDPDKFVEINDAYSVLRDPESRKYYDEFGSNPNDDPRLFMQSVVGTMSTLFDMMMEQSIQIGISLDLNRDFIESFRQAGATIYDQYNIELSKVDKLLKELRKMENRLKRKDEEKNLFVEHINNRVKQLLPKKKEVEFAIKIWDRIFEELEHYEDGNDFFRSMQAAAWPGAATKADSGSVWIMNGVIMNPTT